MTTLLRIDSSATQSTSNSKALSNYYIDLLNQQNRNLTVIEENIGLHPTAHLSQETIGAMYTPAESRTDAQNEALALSDGYIKNLKEADTIVISSPMYNFSIPSTLKAYFDHIARVGETFSYSENGPEGLLKNKKAIVIITSGGNYTQAPYDSMDFVTPVIKRVLNFVGIDDVQIIQAPNMASAGEAQDASIATAKANLQTLVAA